MSGLLPRLARLGLALLLAAGLGACATAQRPDPLEPVNRKVFAFNDAVDRTVLVPVATAYRDTVPEPARASVTHFFANLRDVWSAVNLLLQGRPADGFSDLLRFGTNTVFGVFGLFDVATGLGLPRHDEDFGQTLGKWGMPPGAYIVWPLLGPSTLRDSLGMPLEMQITPEVWVQAEGGRYALTGLRVVNTRANLLQASRVLDDIALDRYTVLRNAYLQRRRNLVYDGNPPEETPAGEERWDLEEAAPAAPVAPSAASSSSAVPARR